MQVTVVGRSCEVYIDLVFFLEISNFQISKIFPSEIFYGMRYGKKFMDIANTAPY